MVKERGRTELLLEVSRTALKTTACWIDASVFHWMKMDANMMQKKDGKLLNEDQLEVKSWYLQIWEVSLLTLSLFEAQLCIQNQFIIWGSVSPRQKEIRNDRRRVWTFPQLLTGIFQPKRQILTLQTSVCMDGADLNMSITQHTSQPSCNFQELSLLVIQYWMLTEMDRVSASLPCLLMSYSPYVQLRTGI